MQMPIGLIADKLNRNYIFAFVGVLLVTGAYALVGAPLAATIVVGIGNGLFHIGGGVDVLNISEEKSGALGVFVSPGAFGVYFGTLLGKGSNLTSPPIVLLLLASAGAILISRRLWSEAYTDNAPFSLEAAPRLMTAVGCLFLVVCMRSYVGLSISFPWKSAGYWAVALVCATVFGKVAGGFLADRFKIVKTATVSLGVAALLFLVPQYPAAGVSSVLLFNMTMPITLWVVAKLFPGAKGFSFGLLTFGLFLGFLPVHLGAQAPPYWLYAILAAISLALLLAGILSPKSGTLKNAISTRRRLL